MNDKDNSKILISLPDYYYNYDLNMSIVLLNQEHPEYFYDNFIIDSIYGSIPCIWNGGRCDFGEVNLPKLQLIIQDFNRHGISIRHTFTNKYIDSNSSKDYLGNKILQLTKNNTKIQNGINVNSEIFAEYIRKNYSDFYILYSTTMQLKEKDIDYTNKLSENNIVVCNYKCNNNFEYLNKLEHPENIEMLFGEACIDQCPLREKHHTEIAKKQMLFSETDFKCPYGCEYNYNFYETITLRNHLITPELMMTKYKNLGINKFKMSGRKDHIVNIIERYIYFLIKPEYKDNIRNKLLLKYIN